MKDFSDKIKKLPTNPGVYLMKDDRGAIIYVGKAKNLKNRVTSYFRGFNSHTPKTQTLVVNIDDFEYIITSTEVEALILEGNLIKKHKPRFNIMLKDDKAYPFIVVTNETYPRVLKVRKVKKDGGRYFGPYSSAYDVNQTLSVIQKTFPIRSCNRDLSKKWSRPCLNYHIKQCLGPCKGNVKQADYRELINDILTFLSGKQDELIGSLQVKMQQAAQSLQFERAAELRDQIQSLKNLTIKQKVSSAVDIDQDVIAAYANDEMACVFIFFVRQGRLIGREHFTFDKATIDSKQQLIEQFILQFYAGTAFIPKEILISDMLGDAKIYETWLAQKKNGAVRISQPKRGDKKKLVDMVIENAKDYLDKYLENELRSRALSSTRNLQLKDLLSLARIPQRIEAYDISNIMGTFSVGSMVVYEDAKKKRSDYRRFKVKTIEGPNDYGSMMEVLYRRFKRGEDAKKGQSVHFGFDKYPDLLLIDGGRGHVSVVKDVLNALKIDIPVAGMVKDKSHKTDKLYFEGENYSLDRRSELYRYLYDIQEEVHRFAISYHRSLRDKQMINSVLDDIKGVGAVRKANLLKHFKTIDKIKNASFEELLAVDGITEKTAQAVVDFFKNR